MLPSSPVETKLNSYEPIDFRARHSAPLQLATKLAARTQAVFVARDLLSLLLRQHTRVIDRCRSNGSGSLNHIILPSLCYRGTIL
jgi:hypothetical protein